VGDRTAENEESERLGFSQGDGIFAPPLASDIKKALPRWKSAGIEGNGRD